MFSLNYRTKQLGHERSLSKFEDYIDYKKTSNQGYFTKSEDNEVFVFSLEPCECAFPERSELSFLLLQQCGQCVQCFKNESKLTGTLNILDLLQDLFKLARGKADEENQIRHKWIKRLKLFIERD